MGAGDGKGAGWMRRDGTRAVAFDSAGEAEEAAAILERYADAYPRRAGEAVLRALYGIVTDIADDMADGGADG